MANLSVAIVGCGKVGSAFGKLLAKAGHTISGVSTRHMETAKKAAETVGSTRFSETPWSMTEGAQVVFITTPDDAIEKTCQLISEKGAFEKNAVVIHCSGALPSSILSSARNCGASVASLHPLQSFATVEEAMELVGGSYCTVEGDPRALPTVRRLVQDLNGILLEISSHGKTVYHAAAVVASNYLVTLIHMAGSLFRTAGLPPDVSFDAMTPLVQGTLKNIASQGIPNALTGPIARGDIATIRSHLDALKTTAPDFLMTYRILGEMTVVLARNKGTLSTEQAEKFQSLFVPGERTMAVERLTSFAGLFILMFLAWLASRDRRHFNLRLVCAGLGIQCLFALVVFKLPAGVIVFSWLNDVVLRVISFAKDGLYFLLGPLALSPGETGPMGETSPGFILAFQVLPSIVFFSSVIGLLYYLQIVPYVVRLFSRIFAYLMRISGAEALCASSNIFVGVESAVTVRPFINNMTRSELCTVLASGMGTIASTVMALYVGFLHQEFPAIAGHLISASVISAPAAIIMSKLVVPEKEVPATLGLRVQVPRDDRSTSWIEAIINGANDGVKLCVGIIALLLAFLGLLSMGNWFLAILGKAIWGTEWSFQLLLGYLYYPLVVIMGVPLEDAVNVATLLGERTIVTEVVAYQHLNQLIQDGVITNPRTITIVSYALCGFAHIASLAIFVGGFSALAPKRARDLAQVGFRALYAATLACLMTGAIAGLFA